MKSIQMAATGLVWSGVAAAASAHPGHLLDDSALDAAHRLGSAHHWLEAVLIVTLGLLAAGSLARHSLGQFRFAPSNADSLRD